MKQEKQIKGSIIQIVGPIIDVRFENEQLPKLLTASVIPLKDGKSLTVDTATRAITSRFTGTGTRWRRQWGMSKEGRRCWNATTRSAPARRMRKSSGPSCRRKKAVTNERQKSWGNTSSSG